MTTSAIFHYSWTDLQQLFYPKRHKISKVLLHLVLLSRLERYKFYLSQINLELSVGWMDTTRNWMANKPLCKSCQHHLGSTQLYILVTLGLLIHLGKVLYCILRSNRLCKNAYYSRIQFIQSRLIQKHAIFKIVILEHHVPH